MLIRGYGEFWSPDVVTWGRQGGEKGCLKGRARPSGSSPHDVDVWTATAVYVLWHDYRPVYLGKADGNHGLGPRLRNHLADRLRSRWDLFSWYSLSKPLRGGGMSKPGKRQVEPSEVLAAFEAFGQRLELPLNRRMESIPGAILVDQVIDKTGVSLESLKTQLDEIVEVLDSWDDAPPLE